MMFSSFTYLIFATTFILVQCKDVRSKKDDNFTEVGIVNCTPEYRSALRDITMNAVCKPYYRHVALKPMPKQIFYPAIVSVQRCDGPSQSGMVCAPTKTHIKKVPVSVRTPGIKSGYGPSGKQCTVVNVEEHISCSVKCKQRESDCNSEQKYEKSICKCVCKNHETKKQECSKAHDKKFWDDVDCKCKCRDLNTDCTTGMTWNANDCKCV